MPVEAAFDSGRDLVTVTVTGSVPARQMLRSIRRILDDPGFHPGIRCLTDMRGATHTADAEEVRRIAQLLNSYPEKLTGTLLAVVVGQAVTYGMLRMLQAQTDGSPADLRVFYDVDEAARWLTAGTDTACADAPPG